MTHPYVFWLLARWQQDELAQSAARYQSGQARRSEVSRARQTLARLRHRRQLGHAVTAPRAPMGCAA